MNTRLIIASIAGAVLYFLLGWLIYGILLTGFYEANTVHYEGLYKAMPNLALLFISNLTMAFLMSLIFQRWAKFTGFSKGMTGGIILGFFISLTYDLSFLSMFNLYNAPATIVDVLVSTVIVGIVGGFIGWILGYVKKGAVASS
jgi:hypothetical protein